MTNTYLYGIILNDESKRRRIGLFPKFEEMNNARNETASAIINQRMNSKWSPFATSRCRPPTPCRNRRRGRGYHRRRWQRALAFRPHRYASVTTDRRANAVSRPVDLRCENIILCHSVRWTGRGFTVINLHNSCPPAQRSSRIYNGRRAANDGWNIDYLCCDAYLTPESVAVAEHCTRRIIFLLLKF